jgi:hypothetical protein
MPVIMIDNRLFVVATTAFVAAIGLGVNVIVPMVMIYLRLGIAGSTASFLATT